MPRIGRSIPNRPFISRGRERVNVFPQSINITVLGTISFIRSIAKTVGLAGNFVFSKTSVITNTPINIFSRSLFDLTNSAGKNVNTGSLINFNLTRALNYVRTVLTGIRVNLSGAGGVWTPDDLTTVPVVWYSAQRSDITESGGLISSIENLGSVADTWDQASDTEKPTYSATGWDGVLPSVEFSNIEYLQIDWTHTGNRLAIFFAADTSGSNGGGDGRIVNCRDAAAGWQNIGNTQVVRHDASNYKTVRNVTDTNFGGGDGKHIAGVIHGASGASARVDGGSETTTAVADNFDFDRVLIGAEDNNNNGIIGAVSEVILLNYEPTTEERQRIEGYLAWEWGIEENLPTGHPYENERPMLSGTPSIIKSVLKNVNQSILVLYNALKTVSKTLGILILTVFSAIKSVSKFLTISSLINVTVTASRAFLRTIDIVVVSNYNSLKSVGKIIGLSVLGNINTVRNIIFQKLVDITSLINVSVTKTVGKLIGITSTVTYNSIKTVGKIVSITSLISVTIAASRAVLKTVDITVTSGFNVLKSIGKTTASSSLSTLGGIVKSVSKNINISSLINISTTQFRTVVTSINTSVLVTFNITKSVLKIVGLTALGNLTTIKSVGKGIETDGSIIFNASKSVSKFINTSALTTLSFLKSVEKVIQTSGNVTLNFVKTVNKIINTSVQILVDVVADFIAGGGDLFFQTVDIVVTGSLSLRKTVSKNVSIVGIEVLNLTKVSGKIVSLIVSNVLNIVKDVSFSIVLFVYGVVGTIKSVLKNISISITISVNSIASLAYLAIINITVYSTTTFSKTIGKIVSAAVGLVTQISKAVSVILDYSISGVLNVRKGISYIVDLYSYGNIFVRKAVSKIVIKFVRVLLNLLQVFVNGFPFTMVFAKIFTSSAVSNSSISEEPNVKSTLSEGPRVAGNVKEEDV